ncbi:hypothetical protein SVAN01_08718 [Stagonosporopsis vannaccii]|nr:hypothetical protein SVAN01_08718 [Stagonosporopsis vannaccii]
MIGSVQADLAGSALPLVRAIVDIQKCLYDRGFDVQENKAELRSAGVLAKTDGWGVLEAAEIDLAMYGELIAVVAGCYVGACEPIGFLTNYASRTKAVMGSQVGGLLTGWVNIFSTITSSITDIEVSARDVLGRLKTLPDRIETIRNRTCQNDACLGPAISNFTQKVSIAMTEAQTIEEVSDSLVDLRQDIPRAITSINKVISVASDAVDTADLIKIASNFTKIEDILGALQIVRELPKLGRELHEDFNTVAKFVTTFGARSNQIYSLFEELLGPSWESLPLEFTTDSSGGVRAGIAEMQTLIREVIAAPIRNVMNAIQKMQDTLKELPFETGDFDVEVGVASYQRWSDFSLKMPCSRTRYQEFRWVEVGEIVVELAVLRGEKLGIGVVEDDSGSRKKDEELPVDVEVHVGIELLIDIDGLPDKEGFSLVALEDADDTEELVGGEVLAEVETVLVEAPIEVTLESRLVVIKLELVEELLSDVTMLFVDSCWLDTVPGVLELVDEIVEAKDSEEDRKEEEDELEDVLVLEASRIRAPQIPAPQTPLSLGGPTPLFRGVDIGVVGLLGDVVVDVELKIDVELLLLLLGVELTLAIELMIEVELALEAELLVKELLLDSELLLNAEILLKSELLIEGEVVLLKKDKLDVEVEEVLSVSSLNRVRPFAPPQVSVTLALHGMLQRPSKTGKDNMLNMFPQ